MFYDEILSDFSSYQNGKDKNKSRINYVLNTKWLSLKIILEVSKNRIILRDILEDPLKPVNDKTDQKTPRLLMRLGL